MNPSTLCGACGAPSKRLSVHYLATNMRRILLCRACAAIVARVQHNLAASRANVGIKDPKP